MKTNNQYQAIRRRKMVREMELEAEAIARSVDLIPAIFGDLPEVSMPAPGELQ